MSAGFDLIWLELLLGFAIPLAFGIWQLQSVKRERAETARKRAAENTSPASEKSD